MKLPKHGKASTYINWGCRCPECKTGMALRNKSEREKRVTMMKEYWANKNKDNLS